MGSYTEWKKRQGNTNNTANTKTVRMGTYDMYKQRQRRELEELDLDIENYYKSYKEFVKNTNSGLVDDYGSSKQTANIPQNSVKYYIGSEELGKQEKMLRKRLEMNRGTLGNEYTDTKLKAMDDMGGTLSELRNAVINQNKNYDKLIEASEGTNMPASEYVRYARGAEEARKNIQQYSGKYSTLEELKQERNAAQTELNNQEWGYRKYTDKEIKGIQERYDELTKVIDSAEKYRLESTLITGAKDYSDMVELGRKNADNIVNNSSYRENIFSRKSLNELREEVKNGELDNETLLGYIEQENMEGIKNGYNTLILAGYATDEEIDSYNYMLGKYGKEKAEKYYEKILDNAKERMSYSRNELFSGYATEYPILSNILTTVGKPVESLYNGLNMLTDGDNNNTNDIWYNGASDIVRGTTTDNIDNYWGKELYKAATAIGDMAVGTVMGNARAYLGTAAGINGYSEAIKRGTDEKSALLYGTVVGMNEVLFEKFSLEQLKAFKNMPATSVKGIIKNAVKSVVTEGSEEAFTDVANYAADFAINGELSEMVQSVEKYMEQGYDKADAVQMMLKDVGGNMLESFTVGGMTGGIMGTGANVVGNIEQGQWFKNNANIENEVKSALAMDNDTQAYKIAENISKKIESGKKVSNSEAAYLYNSMNEAVQQGQEYINYNVGGKRPEDYVTGNSAVKASVKVNGKQKTAIGIESTTKNDARIKMSDGSSAKLSEINFDDAIVQNVYNLASTFDTETAVAYINGYNENVDFTMYNRAFMKARKAGMDKANVVKFAENNMEVLETLGTETLSAAYMAGQSVAKANMSKNQMKVLDVVTQATGTTYEMYTANDGTNGYISNGKVYINTTAENPALVVAAHELTHYMQSNAPAEYEAYKNMVVNYLQSHDIEGYNARIKSLSRLYKNTNESEIMDEVVANAAGDFLLDEKVIKEICVKDKNVAERIVEALSNLIKKIKEKLSAYTNNTYEAKALKQDLNTLEKAKELWTRGIKESSKVTVSKTNNTIQNDENGNKRFSIKESYEEQVRKVISGENFEFSHVYMGNTPKILTDLGLEQLPMLVTSEHVYSMAVNEKVAKKEDRYKSKYHYHGLGEDILNKLPKAIADSGLIIKSYNDENNMDIVVITNLTNKEGWPIMAAVKPNGKGNYNGIRIETNLMKSAYEKRNINTYILNAFKDNRVLMFDKNKSHGLMSNPRVQFPNRAQDYDFDKNIAQYKQIVNKRKENNNAKFSLKETEEVRELTRENKKLQEVVKNLKQQFKLTYGRVPEQSEVKQLARDIIKETDSSYSADTLAENITKLFGNIKDFEKHGISANEAVNITASILKPVLRESNRVDYGMHEQYKELRQELKDAPITLSEIQKAELELAYDSFNDFRKSVFGKIKLSDNGTALEEKWNELSERYPELFDSEATEIEMVPQLLDALDVMEPQYNTAHTERMGYDIDSAAYDMALDLFEKVANLKSMQTYADKMDKDKKETVARLKTEYRQSIADVRATAKAEYEVRLRQAKMEMQDKISANNTINRQEMYRRVAEARAKTRSVTRQNINDRVERTKLRNNIYKNAKELTKWIEKPTDQKHIPDSLKKTTLEIMTSIDFISSRAEPNSEASRDWRDKMAKLKKQLIAADSDNESTLFFELDPDFETIMDEFLEEVENTPKISDMGLKQLKQLDHLIKTIKRTITESGKLRANNRYQKVEQIGEYTINHLDKKKTYNPAKGTKWAKNFSLDLLDPKGYLERFGSAGESIWESLADAQDKRINMIGEAQEHMEEILKGVNVEKWAGETHEVMAHGKKIEMSVTQLMSLYELMKRKQAAGHITTGGITITDINKDIRKTGKEIKVAGKTIRQKETYHMSKGEAMNAINNLTDEQKKIADDMQEFMAINCAKWGNEVSQELYEYNKYTDANYFPIETSKNFTATTDKNVKETVNAKETRLYGIKNQGFTHNIVEKANKPIVIRDIFDVFGNHVVGMANYGAYTIPLLDAMKWYNYTAAEDSTIEGEKDYRSVKSAMEKAMGQEGQKYFLNLLLDINGDSMNDTASGIADKLMSNMKVASVAANTRTAAQQPTAYVRAWTLIDGKYLLKALNVKDYKKDAEHAKKYCPIVKWKSWGYYETMLGKNMKETITGIQGTKDKINGKALLLAEKADELTWGRLWKACELETRDKYSGHNDEEIYQMTGKRMREIVEDTQVVDSVLYKTQASRSGNKLLQAELSFMNEPLKTLNLLRRAVIKENNGKMNYDKIIRTSKALIMCNIINAAVQSVMDALRDDDDYLNFGEKFLKHFEENTFDNLWIINYIPYAKSVWGGLVDGYSMTRNELAGVESLKQGITKLLSDTEGDWYKKSYKIVQGISQLTGIPLGNMMRETKTLYNNTMRIYEGITGKPGLEQWNISAPAYTDKYEMLYNAIIAGDNEAEDRIKEYLKNEGKDDSEISTGIRGELKKDDTVKKAAEMRLTGDLSGYKEKIAEMTTYGFNEDDVIKAITSVINDKKREKEKEGEVATSQESGSSKENLYTKDDLKLAIDSGNTDNVKMVIEEMYNTRIDSGKSRSEAVSSIKTMLTSIYKQEYIMVSEAEQENIKKKLLNVKVAGQNVYSQGEFIKWREYEYTTSDIKTSVSNYDLESTCEIADYLYEIKMEEMTGTVSVKKNKALASIKTTIKSEMKTAYQTADRREKLKIIEFMRKIKINGRQLFNKTDDFKSWNNE